MTQNYALPWSDLHLGWDFLHPYGTCKKEDVTYDHKPDGLFTQSDSLSFFKTQFPLGGETRKVEGVDRLNTRCLNKLLNTHKKTQTDLISVFCFKGKSYEHLCCLVKTRHEPRVKSLKHLKGLETICLKCVCVWLVFPHFIPVTSLTCNIMYDYFSHQAIDRN